MGVTVICEICTLLRLNMHTCPMWVNLVCPASCYFSFYSSPWVDSCTLLSQNKMNCSARNWWQSNLHLSFVKCLGHISDCRSWYACVLVVHCMWVSKSVLGPLSQTNMQETHLVENSPKEMKSDLWNFSHKKNLDPENTSEKKMPHYDITVSIDLWQIFRWIE